MGSAPAILSADERIAIIMVKVERAKKHIVELDGEVRSFIDSNAYEVAAKHDPNTRKLIYYVSRTTPVPHSFSAITGDVIQNLRSALDHLAHQLWFVANPGKTPPRELQFPTDSSAAQYVASALGKIKGLRQDAIDTFDSIEPYDGGKGQDLSVLNRLNRIDKHRLLIAVGSGFQSVNIGAYMSKMMGQIFDVNAIPEMNLYIRPADILFPLKAGDELFIDAVDAEVNKKLDFRFSVVLHEPGVIDGKPILETLQHFADLVSGTISSFRPCLS